MTALDIIGDLHGDLAGLNAIGRELGYNPDAGWSHPDRRHLVFIGDLVDGGPNSLKVSELVKDLVERGRATCLMGNHEYNLIEAHEEIKVRKSNENTVAHMKAHPERWDPVIAFFRALPIAIETDELRLVHAVWDGESIDMLSEHLKRDHTPASFPHPGVHWASPFAEKGLLHGLPDELIPASDDRPHAVLMKGLEAPAKDGPFTDIYGKTRDKERECWWAASSREIPDDKHIVFGHYHHHPPVDGVFAPPHPYGTKELKAWQDKLPEILPTGRRKVPEEVTRVCVDLDAGKYGEGWVGALRWPEREVVWARG